MTTLAPAPPNSGVSPFASDVAAARALTDRHARTFAVACRLLPPDIRDDVYLLYSICRSLDDLVDDGDCEAEAHVRAVEQWARGRPATVTAETRVLDTLDARHRLPRAPLLAFCAGMRHDLEPEPLRTERDVDRYCYRVAGTVGELMAHLLGADGSRETNRAAAALGMAMQRTNILRDIDEDAAAGRVYISDAALRRTGADLTLAGRERLLGDQIARADELYDEGLAGLGRLPRGRAAIAIAASLYREILRELERDPCARRAEVTSSRKLAVVARTVLWGR